jgi:hypothetical protein
MDGDPMKASVLGQDSIDDLNAIALQVDELFKVINDAIWAHEVGMCSLLTGWIATKRLHQEAPEKAEAILARLKALSAMIKNGELNDWLLADRAAVPPAIAHKAIVSAAADHPLSIIGGDITFEKESFLRRVLELAETEGRSSN